MGTERDQAACSLRAWGDGDAMLRGHPTNRVRRYALVIGVGLLACGPLACAGSRPVRAVRAARYYAVGTRALDRGEARAAIDALELAVGLMPNASEIHNHLGLAYWSDGRTTDALRAFERAIELDCENEAARVNHARLRAGMGAANREAGIDGDGRSRPSVGNAVDGSTVHGG